MSSIGMSAAAIGISASTLNGVKKLSCDPIVKEFNPTTATIEQKQAYANCIDTLHPQNEALIQSFQVLFILFFVVLIASSVVFYVRERGYGFSSTIDNIGFSILQGFLTSFLICGILFLIIICYFALFGV